ncbi:hypothetical protein PA0553 [Candidatus Phytoplasma australiense]|uniref:Uncharacterized protein n=1 Tax=Phytoplasma australiense TaxID=59748 RepID=B1VAB4_PHYAS|nr:hypothetical protein PA0553 [Candidatus Phytoplasma australiense]
MFLERNIMEKTTNPQIKKVLFEEIFTEKNSAKKHEFKKYAKNALNFLLIIRMIQVISKFVIN